MSLTLVTVRRKLASKKAIIFLFMCIAIFLSIGSYLQDIKHISVRISVEDNEYLMNRWHTATVQEFFGRRRRVAHPSSILGGILFEQNEIPDPNPNANRTFVILVWKYWNWLKRRHVFNFGKHGDKENIYLEGCSVNNCIFSGNESLIDTADAVVIHLQHGLVPTVDNRTLTQRWIFLNDESPKNAFSLAKTKPTLESLYNVFNWSMTYRSDADVPVPYGRALALKKPLYLEYKTLENIVALVPYWERKKSTRIAAVLMSNCGVKARNDFLEKLRKYVAVDVFGGCSDKEKFKSSCPGHFRADCEPVAEYLFYLVLENTSCFQYLTEKVFYHAYSKGAVPVIFGPRIEDVASLLPPNFYLHAHAGTDIKILAKNMNALAQSTDLLLGMHMWRNHFEIVNEHGYFKTKSYHLCRVCEALNYNNKSEKVYNKDLLDSFLDPARTCYGD